MSIDLCNIIAFALSKPDFRPTCIAIFFLLKIALGKRARRKSAKKNCRVHRNMQQICYEYVYRNESRHSLQTYAFRCRNI